MAAPVRAQQPPPGLPARLFFLGQPRNVAANTPFGVQLALADANGVVVAPSADVAVTLTLESNPAGGALSGTLTQTAPGGIAAFRDLSIDAPGQGYTLRAVAIVAGAELSATSNPFRVYLRTAVAIETPAAEVRFGDAVTLAAAVTPCQADSEGPRGKMEFSLGPLSLTAPISGGSTGCRATVTAILADPRLEPGPYGLAAAFYSANPNYGFSRQSVPLSVAPAPLLTVYDGDVFVNAAGARAAANLRARMYRVPEPGGTPSGAASDAAGLFGRLNRGRRRVWVEFYDCSGARCSLLGAANVADAGGGLAAGEAALRLPLPPGNYLIETRLRQTADYFAGNAAAAGEGIAAAVTSPLVVAREVRSGAAGAGWAPDASSSDGRILFAFSLRSGRGSASLSGGALLAYPSVFQGVPARVRIRTEGPIRAEWLEGNQVRVSAPARIEVVDRATGALLAGPQAGGAARITMLSAEGPPARFGIEVLNPDGSLFKRVSGGAGGRLSPVPIALGRIVVRAPR